MSNSFTPMPREFARRLLEYQTASAKPGEAKSSAAFHICEKLREPLGKMMGLSSFGSLLARAQVLAGAEVPWLLMLEVKADASLGGLSELEAKLDPRAVANGEVVLVGQLFGLLVLVIGPAVTLHLVHQIWPQWRVSPRQSS